MTPAKLDSWHETKITFIDIYLNDLKYLKSIKKLPSNYEADIPTYQSLRNYLNKIRP